MFRDPGGPAEGGLPYLGLACGFFAKLAARKGDPFSASTRLLHVAQQVVEKSRPLVNHEEPDPMDYLQL